jgi:hypothetical protein
MAPATDGGAVMSGAGILSTFRSSTSPPAAADAVALPRLARLACCDASGRVAEIEVILILVGDLLGRLLPDEVTFLVAVLPLSDTEPGTLPSELPAVSHNGTSPSSSSSRHG